ncbi:MAG: hypothetical protein M3527_04260 [Actinomycetota bacterium]|nr:hypothetical protein [Acidimicrobiia bacterium]MDQ3293646.1 hypothetical protein [Actinomycetota bacterium]
MRFAPYHRLDGAPNVIVDGAPTDGTVLSISHWPNLPSPPGLEDDTSALMAFRYLRRPDLHVDAELVSNNHFDQDGLVSTFALVEPEKALAREEVLVDLAAAGDFATYRHRQAARASMVVSAFASGRGGAAADGPLADVPEDDPEMDALLYRELLGRLPEIVDHVERYEALWADEDATLEASEQLLARGGAIEEVPALELAIVTVDATAPDGGGHRFGGDWAPGLHPMAVHNATDRVNVATIRGRRYDVELRYEGWVQYRSRTVRPRRDLGLLAARLQDEEASGGTWLASPVSAIVPRLRLDGADASSIAPDRFRALLEQHLAGAPPAWDPFTPPAGA